MTSASSKHTSAWPHNEKRERERKEERGVESDWRKALLAGIAGLGLSWLGEYHYRQMAHLPSDQQMPESLPSLSIVVPARNEANNLPQLLASLRQLCYPGPLEIVVVDDGSEDNTAEIARQQGVRVLSLDGPPPGWSGKAYACHQGARQAQGEWLLFTDADTRHAPHGPARSVAYAEEQNLDGLSLFLDQESQGIGDRLALLVAHAGLFVSLRHPEGMLNGQYILLRHDVYEKSRGFAVVPDEATEDLALGHHLRRQRFKVPILRGEEAASVHMYRSVQEMWRGLARFGVSSLRWLGLSSLVAVLHTIFSTAPLEIMLYAWIGRRPLWPAFFSWLLTAIGLLPWAQRFGGWWWALLAPLGAIQVQMAAIWGLLRRLSGRGIVWKERKL